MNEPGLAEPDWHVAESSDAFARLGADTVAEAWTAATDRAILVATGATPMPVYAELARRAAAGVFEVPRSPVVQLDEYVGIGDEDPRSLYGWMRRSFLGPLGIDEGDVIRLRGDAEDVPTECARFDAEVRSAGGLGFAVLGLGPNGHLGFNEPPSSIDAPTRRVALTPESLRSNARYWDGREVPTHALTAGMSLILSADVVLLLVAGAHKHVILERAVRGPEDDDVPASHLRRAARLVVVCDRAALTGTG